MKVLFLGPSDSPVQAFLQESGEKVVGIVDPIDPSALRGWKFDIIVSHGYRHILKPDVLVEAPDMAINLHISYLPWNRGADPNLWSWIDDTPKGVTIHYIDEGVDTGDIVAQRRIEFGHAETLASSYERLQWELIDLFRQHWPSIRQRRCNRRPQEGAGTFHLAADRKRVEEMITAGWQTPVSSLARGARGEGRSAHS